MKSWQAHRREEIWWHGYMYVKISNQTILNSLMEQKVLLFSTESVGEISSQELRTAIEFMQWL